MQINININTVDGQPHAKQMSTCYARMTLTLIVMTFILELHLDIVKRYLQAKKINFLGQGIRKLEHEQDMTDTQTHTNRRD